VTQLGLFDVPVSLRDSERGQISYQAKFLPIEQAEAWFPALRDGVDWHARRRVMYEREVDVPRLTAHFSLDELGDKIESKDLSPAAADVLAEGARRVGEAIRAAFNSIGLNYYRDGNDSVAPHNDRLQDLVEGSPIALVSLGATRRMLIRAKDPGEAAVPIDLVSGSLLVMSYSSQLHYTHGVPKTRLPAGPRISVALRVRPR
jgi:alkylated DNA repair dioxygenase AlkB